MKSRRVAPARSLVAATIILCAVVTACSDNPVAPSPTPDRATSLAYCAAATPTWVAFRDGDGSWTRETPDVAGSRTFFRHVFTSERAAIATLTPIIDGQFTVLRVLYGTPAELATESDTTPDACTTGGGKTLHGSVAGLDLSELATISIGAFGRTSVAPRLGLDFTVDGVLSGPQDLLAVRTRESAPPRLILRRDIDLPDGSVLPSLDFASAEAFDVATANVDIQNGGADEVLNSTALLTRHGTFPLPFGESRVAATTEQYIAIPPARLLATDLQQLHVSTAGATPRTTDLYFRLPIDLTVTLGAPLIPPSFTISGSEPMLRPRAQFVAQSDYDKLTSVVYDQSSSTAFVAISMTPSYAALSGGYDLEVPDLSSVAGFDASWGLHSGAVVNWNALRTGGSLPIGRSIVPVNGAIRRITSTQGTLTAP